MPKGIRIRLGNPIFPNWKQQKYHLSQPETFKKMDSVLFSIFFENYFDEDLR